MASSHDSQASTLEGTGEILETMAEGEVPVDKRAVRVGEKEALSAPLMVGATFPLESLILAILKVCVDQGAHIT